MNSCFAVDFCIAVLISPLSDANNSFVVCNINIIIYYIYVVMYNIIMYYNINIIPFNLL